MQQKTVSGILLILLLVGLLTLEFNIQPAGAEPKTWTVDDDGPADFHTIQEALNTAGEGDTILVRSGTYYENLLVKTSIALLGEDRGTTIIDGNNSGHVVHIESYVQDVVISHFTIRNSGSSGAYFMGSGVYAGYPGGGDAPHNITVSNNTITENRVGVCLFYSDNDLVKENTITKNGYGVISLGGVSSNLESNLVANNTRGIILLAAGGTTLENNTMRDNMHGLGVTGSQLSDFFLSIDTSNTVEGKPVHYLVNQQNMTVDPSTFPEIGYLAFVNSTDISIKNLTLSSSGQGVFLAYTNNSYICNNNVTNNYYGIHLFNSFNNGLCQNHLTTNNEGILIENCSNNTLTGNNLLNNSQYGIRLKRSTQIRLRNNNITGSEYGFSVHGHYPPRTTLSEFIHSIDTSNRVNEKPIYYMVNQHDLIVNSSLFPEIGYLGLVNCSNMVVENVTLASNEQGLLIAYTNNSSVLCNTLTGNEYGLDLHNVFNTTLTGNNIVENHFVGICLSNCSANMLRANIIRNNWRWGVELRYNCSANLLTENTIQDHGIGLVVLGSSDNKIVHNNFLNNSQQVHIYSHPESSNNSWDDGYPAGGNYWSDYDGTDFFGGLCQNETGGDRLGDTAYIVGESDTDRYPLMGPWTTTGENVTVVHVQSGVSLTFENTTSSGITTVNESQTGPDPASNFKLALDPPIYYDIATSANYSGLIKLSIPYNDTGLTQEEENNLQLTHWNETRHQWINITTVADIENNTIHGETTHLSLFTLVTTLTHDVAAAEIKPSKTVVGQGHTIAINVTVTNQGDLTETFNITAYGNTTIIETIERSLTSGNSTILTIPWNTTGVATGNYTVSANVTILPGETDTADNTLQSVEEVMVVIFGDLNGDGIVDISDIAAVARCYGALEWMHTYNVNYDLNDDGIIDISDIALVARHYGET